jgi:3-oxoacyl-[acyl-carrier protein] reductase
LALRFTIRKDNGVNERPIAMVTGGSRGIGRAVALRLAADGFDIALCSRTASPAAQATIAEVESTGARCFFAECDVADDEASTAFVTQTESEFGPIDALVTSAGVIRDKPLVTMSTTDWTDVIDTNLTGTFNVCRSVVFPMMKRRRGVILTMSSVSGVHGKAMQTNYSAAKAGIIGFSKALAKEVARSGIRVNVVAPGFIETDMTAGLSDKVRKQALLAIPLGRFGTPEMVADLTSFLASPQATYITGQVIQLDGGIAL